MTCHNKELDMVYKEPNVVEFIRLTRLRWAGHVMRKEGSDKKVFALQPEGKQAVGWQRLRLIDGLDSDTRVLGIMNWWTTVLDNDGWCQLLWEARIRRRVVKLWMMMMMNIIM